MHLNNPSPKVKQGSTLQRLITRQGCATAYHNNLLREDDEDVPVLLEEDNRTD